ncbi:MAG: uroporphyrinogen decarboxylase family protein [Candidatus Helarchaeota archaeon]
MECRERVLAALNLEEPDRVPTHLLYFDSNLVNEVLGKPAKNHFQIMAEMYRDYPDTWVEQFNGILKDMQIVVFFRLLEAAHMIGIDAAQIGIIPLTLLPPDFKFSTDPTEYKPLKYDMKFEMIDIFGKIWAVRDNEGNISPQYKRPTVTSREEWEKIKEKFENGVHNPYLKLAKKYFKRAKKKFQNKIYFFATNELASIWASTWQGMGMEFFVKQLYKDRAMIEDMFNTYTDFTINWLNAYMDGGAEVCLCTDDLATKTGPFMSPKIFIQLLQPCYQRLTENIHERGGKVILHTDGQITPLLEFIVECGFDGLHCLEPAAGVDLSHVKKKVGDKLCLFGNIDTHLLSIGNKEEVEATVKKAIKAAGPGGGFVVSPENMLHTVRVEALQWMVEATHKFGKYPLPV